MADADIILVGGGLASALTATRLATLDNPPAILILERGDRPFADHTWSFHQHDITAADHRWISALVAHRWSGHDVRFKDLVRHIPSHYFSLTSESVAAHVETLQNVRIRANAAVSELAADHIRLADGTRLDAPLVIDARGFVPDPALKLGFQKFVGLEVELAEPHGLTDPLMMDATVPQLDGYRFVYCLPFSPTRVLIEDTRYSDDPTVDADRFVAGIDRYAADRGWTISSRVRQEQGCLPIALAFDAERFWRAKPAEVPVIGLRAALFHPTTGYSLPEAVTVADLIAEAWPIRSAELAQRIRAHAVARAGQQRFYRLLNRMLFKAAEPDERHWVLQRFYGLPEPLIDNFYAGRTTLLEKMRILSGRPPVPVTRALRCLSERAMLDEAA